MTKSVHPERETQNRIVQFFQKELGYTYLGNLEDSENYNIRWGDWKRFLYDSGILLILLMQLRRSSDRLFLIFLNPHITRIKKFTVF